MLRPEICISFKNLCCDQENFQVSLNNSIPNKFNSPNPIKISTIQFIFIIQIFNESIQLCIRFKIEAQNLKKFPQTFNHAISETKFNKPEKSILPPFVSCSDWKFECRDSSLCTLLLSCKKHTYFKAIIIKSHKTSEPL